MSKILITIITSLSVAALTALGTWFIKQITKYKKLIRKEEDEIVKKTINAALSTQLIPIKEEIQELKKIETRFQTRLQPTQEEIEHLKDDITEILNSLKGQGIDLLNIKEKVKDIENREIHLENETRCAWRYRIRQLCHVYLGRGWMSWDEYSQLQEMYNLYTAIGGNGQTKELYEKTIQLEIKTENEIKTLLNKKQGA